MTQTIEVFSYFCSRKTEIEDGLKSSSGKEIKDIEDSEGLAGSEPIMDEVHRPDMTRVKSFFGFKGPWFTTFLTGSSDDRSLETQFSVDAVDSFMVYGIEHQGLTPFLPRLKPWASQRCYMKEIKQICLDSGGKVNFNDAFLVFGARIYGVEQIVSFDSDFDDYLERIH